MAEVLVLVDHEGGEIKKVSYELLTAAARLGEPSAVVVGAPGTAAALKDGLARYGAAKIYVAESDDALTTLQASLPAVVSVGEKINEPRYPSFKGIMAAKKKPVTTMTLADVGIDAGEVGLANATSTVTDATPRPPREAGQVVTDEGDGAAKLVEYLVGQKLI